jgi:hypothetical protein
VTGRHGPAKQPDRVDPRHICSAAGKKRRKRRDERPPAGVARPAGAPPGTPTGAPIGWMGSMNPLPGRPARWRPLPRPRAPRSTIQPAACVGRRATSLSHTAPAPRRWSVSTGRPVTIPTGHHSPRDHAAARRPGCARACLRPGRCTRLCCCPSAPGRTGRTRAPAWGLSDGCAEH